MYPCVYIYIIPNSLGHSARKALVKRRIRREGWIFGAGERISRQASQPGQKIRCSDDINISWQFFFSNLATQPSWSDVHFKWRQIFRLQAMLRSTCFRVEGLAGWAVKYIAGSNAASKCLILILVSTHHLGPCPVLDDSLCKLCCLVTACWVLGTKYRIPPLVVASCQYRPRAPAPPQPVSPPPAAAPLLATAT